MEGIFLEIPAVHEAGRAVLRYLFHNRIECIAIDRRLNRLDGTAAESASWARSLRTPEEIQRVRREAMICCAGDIAAHMHFGRQLRRHELAGKPTIDRAAGIAVAQYAIHTQELAQYIHALLEDTYAELDIHWPKVERLAAVLLKRRRVSADEAASILVNDTLG